MLVISHDRALLDVVADKVVTLEGHTAWTHGASFATWHEARDARVARIDEDHRRYREERKRLEAVAAASSAGGPSMGSDVFASRVRVDEDEDRAVRSRRRRPSGCATSR